MLTYDDARALERKLEAYNDSTSTQIAVVIVPTLNGEDIAQYATELGAKWGIGEKGKDNGVLLVISQGDHQVFIATGRGVEANLPDIIVKRIIDHVITPQFKAGHYYAGINAATDEIIARLSGQFVNDNTDKSAGNARWIALVIVVIFLLLMIWGGGRGGQTYGGGGSILPWFFLGGLLGGGSGGVGGFNGGYGDSGGGSDGGGGGFGGFGGGDFGGGGAGGSW
jgi:uncharacterized protein